VSRQSNQREQDCWKRPTADEQSDQYRFEDGASTLRVSNTYLGAQFRRFRTKLDARVAVKAMAAKLARLVYRMMRYGMKYVDQGARFYEAQHRNLQGQTAKVEGRQARIPTCPDSRKLTHGSFWGARKRRSRRSPRKASPERDKLQMKIEGRGAVSFSWVQTKQIAEHVYKLDVDSARKERYAMVFVLAAATGLRCGELFALRLNDVGFKAATIRVDESADQRTYKIGPCKNAAAYRTVLLADSQGKRGRSQC